MNRIETEIKNAKNKKHCDEILCKAFGKAIKLLYDENCERAV